LKQHLVLRLAAALFERNPYFGWNAEVLGTPAA